MVECAAEEIDFTECGCRFADTSCIEVRGKGSAGNKIRYLFNFDPDERNILECGTYGEGLFAQMADRFVWPSMRKVRDIPVPLLANDPIPFSTVEYDPYGMSSTLEVGTIPFDGIWRVQTYANFDNNDGSYNTLRLEFNQGAAYGIISAQRESRDRDSTDESFINLADEFAMKTGDRVRITVGEDATKEVWIKSASMIITLVSL